MLKITLVKSVIGAKPVNRKTVVALGLRKTGRTVYREDVPSIRGMIHNVQHLLSVETVDGVPKRVAKPKKAKAKAAPKVAVVRVKDRPSKKKATAQTLVVSKPKKEAVAEKAQVEAPKAAAKKPAEKKPAAKKTAAKKPAAAKTKKAASGRKPETDRKSFGEIGKTDPKKKNKES
jgi:large subunit ribosomal protein L30